jgi:hypothetical protein
MRIAWTPNLLRNIKGKDVGFHCVLIFKDCFVVLFEATKTWGNLYPQAGFTLNVIEHKSRQWNNICNNENSLKFNACIFFQQRIIRAHINFLWNGLSVYERVLHIIIFFCICCSHLLTMSSVSCMFCVLVYSMCFIFGYGPDPERSIFISNLAFVSLGTV